MHVGKHCFGDAFVVKVVEGGGDGKGNAAYVDVAREVLRTRVVGMMVGQLRELTEM